MLNPNPCCIYISLFHTVYLPPSLVSGETHLTFWPIPHDNVEGCASYWFLRGKTCPGEAPSRCIMLDQQIILWNTKAQTSSHLRQWSPAESITFILLKMPMPISYRFYRTEMHWAILAMKLCQGELQLFSFSIEQLRSPMRLIVKCSLKMYRIFPCLAVSE